MLQHLGDRLFARPLAAAAVAALGLAAASHRLCDLLRARAAGGPCRPAPAASARNGIMRHAGQKAISGHDGRRHAERLRVSLASCLTSALSAAPATPAFETSRPAAVETISAGIWRDEAVADGQQRVGRAPPGRSGMLCCSDADDDAADDVDER